MDRKDNKKSKEIKPKKNRPLTPDEIRSTVAKIRGAYDSVIIGYMLSPKIKDAFEDRYLQAMRARVDMGSFLAAEMMAVRRLAEEKDELRVVDENRRLSAGGTRENGNSKKSEGVADRMVRLMREKIDRYPGIGLRWDDSIELDRLYGALRQLEADFWTPVAKILRRVYPSRYSGPLVTLEKQFFEYAGYGGDGFPPRLYTYVNLENRFPRNDQQLQQESMRCILDASFFLHEVGDALRELLLENSLDLKERKQVEMAADFVHTIKDDFRLHDLKRSKE